MTLRLTGVCLLSLIVATSSHAQPPKAKPAAARTDTASHAKPAGFRNEDVIELVAAGFGDDLIAARIQHAPEKSFDLSTKGLVRLKAAGVSERLIGLMLSGPDAGAPRTAAATASAAASAVRASSSPTSGSTAAAGSAATAAATTTEAPAGEKPWIPGYAVTPSTRSVEGREAGIYLKQADALVALEPAVFSGAKSGGVLTSGLTFGIKKAKWKAVVRTTRALLRVQTARPEFYFYFESRGSGLGRSGLIGATSPNEFVLVRMNQKSDERELVVGEFGMMGASTGTRSEDTIELAIERLEPGVYRVAPRAPLEDGEYCFFNAAGSSGFMSAGTGKLFDFGVDLDSRTQKGNERP